MKPDLLFSLPISLPCMGATVCLAATLDLLVEAHLVWLWRVKEELGVLSRGVGIRGVRSR